MRSRALAAVLGGVLLFPALVNGGPAHAAQGPGCPARAGAAPVLVRTVPAVPGFRFGAGGVTRTTGPDGTAWLPPSALPCSGPAGGAMEALDEQVQLGDRGALGVARFARWQSRTTDSDAVAAATFTVQRDVDFRFVDPEGRAVARDELGSVTLKSSTGGVYEVGADSRLTLPSARVVRLSGGLEVKDLYYSVERVDINGNTVVNRSQIRFYPSQVQSVDVPLLHYALEVRAVDAFFGTSIGSELLLKYPDGKVESHPLDEQGALSLPRLPRGDYQMQVVAPGLRLWRPIAMSKSQDLELEVFSYLDIAVVLSSLLVVAVGLLVVGLRRRRRYERHGDLTRRRPVMATADLSAGRQT